MEQFGDFKSNPKGLEITTIDQLFSVGSSKRVFQKDWKSSGVPFYRAREIVKLSEQGFVDNELFITEEMYKEYAHRYGVPQAGDIMVTGVGTLGICYLVRPGDGVCHIIAETSADINRAKVISAVHRIAGDLKVDFVVVPQDEHLARNQADAIRCGDNGIPVGVWEVSTEDEKALDRYEGYPNFYYKKELTLPIHRRRWQRKSHRPSAVPATPR